MPFTATYRKIFCSLLQIAKTALPLSLSDRI